MTLYNKSQLQKKAEPVFKKHGVNKLYATEDGQIFLLDNRANLHAGGKLRVFPLYAEAKAEIKTEANDGSQEPFLNVKNLLASLKGKTAEELSEAMVKEIAGQNRKSAVAGIQEMLDEAVNVPEGDPENKTKTDDKEEQA
ncbi:MAG: hypothetical protein M9892_04600 [Bacteroidetes bacterium]|nr:hypothetical protein [Bacteroidota bacterium]